MTLRQKIQISDVSIDRFIQEDIKPFVDYWHDTPIEFWQQRGITPVFTIDKQEHSKQLLAKVKEGSLDRCTVKFKGLRIGVHTLTHRKENTATMHAHYWDTSHRGLGIGPISYVKAMHWLFENAGLSEIQFKTPQKNKAPNKVKEKLGIPVLKEVLFDAPILKEPVPAYLSKVSPEDLPGLFNRLEAIYTKDDK